MANMINALSTHRPLLVASGIQDDRFDCVVVVAPDADHLLKCPALEPIKDAIEHYSEVDQSSSGVMVIYCPTLPGKRLVYSKMGPVTRDYDDVRKFQEAARSAMNKALSSGSRRPLLVCLDHSRYPLAARVQALGALHAFYTPLEIRETRPDKRFKADQLGLFHASSSISEQEVSILRSVEVGRIVCRDIGGGDPERMAPPSVAECVRENFKDTCIKVDIIDDVATLEKEYPLLSAVNRASRNVPRHLPCVIFLTYEGEGPVTKTLRLVGKGVTFDTGGSNIKIGASMHGMCRDKCGAAFVAGFFKTLSMLKPKGIKVVGAMAVVRNSVGSEAYVCDEVIESRAGVRIRITNTDAEGRMAMADVLCHMKEKSLAENDINPQLFTIATLTGHVSRCYSDAYSAVLGNGPSVSQGIPQALFDAGARSADPFEISTLRREDYEKHQGKSEYEEAIQSNLGASTGAQRGHQAPMAFLILTAGLDKHGNDSEKPLAYTHLDIAGSSGSFPAVPTAAPLVAFTHTYVI